MNFRDVSNNFCWALDNSIFHSQIAAMQIEHKNIILTGAASGIGKALLNQLIDFEGIKIVAVDLNKMENTSEKSYILSVIYLNKRKSIDFLRSQSCNFTRLTFSLPMRFLLIMK